jgi:pilus assembly protein Flp/PilA
MGSTIGSRITRTAGGLRKAAGAFVADEDGATAIEYALIAGGIAVAIITVLFTIGSEVNGKFGEVNSGF